MTYQIPGQIELPGGGIHGVGTGERSLIIPQQKLKGPIKSNAASHTKFVGQAQLNLRQQLEAERYTQGQQHSNFPKETQLYF